MGLTHLLTAALAATLTTAATLPLSPRIPAAPRIKTVSFTGKGCPLNQGTATVSGSASGLTLSLNQFNVTSGLGGTRMDEIKACEAAITIDDGVSGWALAVGSVSHEGTFFGVGDVRLGLSSTTFWQSSVEEAVDTSATFTTDDLKPTLKQASLTSGIEDLETPFASSCVGDDGEVGTLFVKLTANIRATAGSAGAFIGTKDAPVVEYVEFGWIPCGDLPA